MVSCFQRTAGTELSVRPMFLMACAGRIMDAANTRKKQRSAHP